MNLDEAKVTLEDWKSKVVWKRSFGRPFRMQEIQVEALLATWEALDGTRADRSDSSRCHELRKRCKELSNSLSRMDGMPVMARSFEHRVSLEQARWGLAVLATALELWAEIGAQKDDEKSAPRAARQKADKSKAKA